MTAFRSALFAFALGALGACTGNDLEGHASHTSPHIAGLDRDGLPWLPGADAGPEADAWSGDDARSDGGTWADADASGDAKAGLYPDGAGSGHDGTSDPRDARGAGADDALGGVDGDASGSDDAGAAVGGDAAVGDAGAGAADDVGGGGDGAPDAGHDASAGTSDTAVVEDLGPPQPPGLDPEWCRLWHPAVYDGPAGSPFMVYSHVSVPGLTDQTADGPDPAPWLRGEIGYGPVGALPTTHPQLFTWTSASPEANPPAWVFWRHDRYETALAIPLAGLYDYAARFSGDYGATWLYCDLDGSQNGYTAAQSGRANLTP